MMIVKDKEYTEEQSCKLLGISENTLRRRLQGTIRNGERIYRGADLQRVGSLIAIEKLNKKMEVQNNER